MKNEKNARKSIAVIAVVLSVLVIAMVGTASASPKSLYLVADHHGSPTPINAYDIGPGGFPLTYQATYNVTSHDLGASGLAMYDDPNGDGDFSDAQIFVTYESSNLVEVFNAVDLTPVPGTPITAAGASDLAGIVVDQEKELVYTVDRFTQNLYVYDANTFAPVGTLPIVLSNLSTDYGAVGLALDETNDWLFVTDFTPIVHYFDTATWSEVGTITTKSVYAISIAYDEANQLAYTSGAFYSDYLLAKYDMTTGTATSVDVETVSNITGCGAMGLALDPATGLLYVTTGYSGDDLRVFDSSLSQVYLYPDTEGMILNPAGICIPREEISYNPLNLIKDDGLAEDECVSPGGIITYDICYDNMRNAYDVHNVVITDTLPVEVSFVSATGGGTYASGTHTVTWGIGTLTAGTSQQCVQLKVQVDSGTAPGTTITNHATIDSDETPQTTTSEETDVCEEGIPVPQFGPIGSVALLGMLVVFLARWNRSVKKKR